MSAAHIEAGTEVTVTVWPWVMQCCCGLGGPATVAVVAVDVVAGCSAADCRVETSAPTSTPLLCTEILTLSLLCSTQQTSRSTGVTTDTALPRHTTRVSRSTHNTTRVHVST